MPNHVSTVIHFLPKDSIDEMKIKDALEQVRSVEVYENGQEVNFFDLNKILNAPKLLDDISYYKKESLIYFLTERNSKPLNYALYNLYREKSVIEPNHVLTTQELKADFDKMVAFIESNYNDQGDLVESVHDQSFIAKPQTLDLLYTSGKALVELYDKYKVNSAYDWFCEYWGTKWNTYSTHLNGNALFMQSAWSAPQVLINKFISEFGFDAKQYTFDEGHCFWYEAIFKDGELIGVSNSEESRRAEIYQKVYGYSLDEDEDEDEDTEQEIKYS
jgi:hypothetical protein